MVAVVIYKTGLLLWPTARLPTSPNITIIGQTVTVCTADDVSVLDESQLTETRQNIAITFGMEKPERCGYLTVKKIEDMFIRFDRIHERDRQTDKQTSHDGIGRAYA